MDDKPLVPRNRAERRRLAKETRAKTKANRREADSLKERIKQETYKELLEKMKENFNNEGNV